MKRNTIKTLAACAAAMAAFAAFGGDLALHPIPATAAFSEDGYFVWCGSVVKDDEGTYHLFYSRWKKSEGINAWRSHSEIARATSKDLFGTFVPQGVVLPERGGRFWDGHCTHNPTIHRFGAKYYLYYMGNVCQDGTEGCLAGAPGSNQRHRDNNQRIGVAVADRPEGPWTRFDRPLIDVSDDEDAPDSLVTTNPAVTECPDGTYLMVYKAASRRKGSPVVCLSATSKSPTGPFEKRLRPFFTAGDARFPAEDPFVWFGDGMYHALVKDMGGHFLKGRGRTVVLFESEDGHDWKLADDPLVTDTTLRWADGRVEKVNRLERPQLYFEDGRPVALLAAVGVPAEAPRFSDLQHTFNVRIPLVPVVAPRPSAPLKFMTFNIWGDYFGNPVGEREAGVEVTILKEMPDVVSLQEVTPNWYKSQMFVNLKKSGYVLVRGDEAAALKRAAFFGKKTAKHINHEPLLYRNDRLKLLDSGTDFFHLSLQTSKSVTWAVLEDKTGKRRFAAFATHFWWQNNGKESDTIRELNARHILWLLADIRRKWGAELPAILGGDLNSTEKSIAHAMLRSGGFVNAASNADVRSPHCSHHGNPKRGEDGKYHGSLRPAKDDTPDRSIDHIYYTRGIHALRHEIVTDQTALDASDHSPVIVEFELR